MSTLTTGRVYFTTNRNDAFGYWDAASGSVKWDTRHNAALLAALPLAGSSLVRVGAFSPLSDGGVFMRADGDMWSEPDVAEVMGIRWNADLSIASAVGVTATWGSDPFSPSTYISPQYGLGCVAEGQEWLTWQPFVTNAEENASGQPAWAQIVGTSLTPGPRWEPNLGHTYGFGGCQVYHSDGFIYRTTNSANMFERFNPTTGQFQRSEIAYTAADPSRGATRYFVGFTSTGGFVTVDPSAGKTSDPLPGWLKVYDFDALPWTDIGLEWPGYDGPAAHTIDRPTSAGWDFLNSGGATGTEFIVDDRLYFNVALAYLGYESDYGPIGPDTIGYGRRDDDGAPLGNSIALYSLDLLTGGDVQLEALIPYQFLAADGTPVEPGASYTASTDSGLRGMTYLAGFAEPTIFGIPPLRQLQRGDGLGMSGAPRAIQNNSRQASLRNFGFQ